jgi:NADPH:quinone reductase-like Zn-dependent oxidoreductase
MKAVVRDRYGGPDVVAVREVPVPATGPEEVLIKVVASSLNGSDAEVVRGVAFTRFGGVFRPRDRGLGTDVAGVVEAVGANVSRLKPGDEVVGDLLASNRIGAFAEYAVAADRVLRLKPAGVTFEDAATLPQAAVLAVQAMRYGRRLEAGERVLVNGAGGGTGTFAVQIAKALGADVTGVDGPSKLDMLLSLRADHVIDHTKQDFAKGATRYDRVIDVVARRSVLAARRALGPDGVYLIVGGTTPRIVEYATIGSLVSIAGRRQVRLMIARLGDPDDTDEVLRLVESGTIKPVIDRIVSLEEVPDAFRRLMDGQVLGKVVVRI